MRFSLRATPEVVVLTILLVLALLGLAFMGALVAEPKLLFGRSLSALAPSLFPRIVITALAIICGLTLFRLAVTGQGQSEAPASRAEITRGIVFFGIMTLYALTMVPLGFLIASAIAIVLMSVQMGNRSVWQIAVLAVAAPVLLYLAATRLLAVSLPELNAIELAYARLLGE